MRFFRPGSEGSLLTRVGMCLHSGLLTYSTIFHLGFLKFQKLMGFLVDVNEIPGV